jgi:hypothetical protein
MWTAIANAFTGRASTIKVAPPKINPARLRTTLKHVGMA